MKVNPLYDNVYKIFGQTLLDKWIREEDKYELQNNPTKLKDMAKTLLKYYSGYGFWYIKMMTDDNLKAFKMCFSLSLRNQPYIFPSMIETAIFRFKLTFVKFLLSEYELLRLDVNLNFNKYINYICGENIYISYRPANYTVDLQIELIEEVCNYIPISTRKNIPSVVYRSTNHALLSKLLKIGFLFEIADLYPLFVQTTNLRCLHNMDNGYLCLSIIFKWFEELQQKDLELFKAYISSVVKYLENYIDEYIYKTNLSKMIKNQIYNANFLSYETSFWRENIPKLIQWSKEVEVDCNILETYINVARRAPINILRNRIIECYKEKPLLNIDVVKHVLVEYF